MLPIVAIVGRPNVGKSTLFNRLVGGRPAIVHDRPGVTRDRHHALTDRWCGRELVVVDTGGLEPEPGDDLYAAMRRQALAAIDEADVVVWVVDARAGLTPVDREVADLLRRVDRPVLIAANKVDDPALEVHALEFHGLGLPEVFPISAEHGRGVGFLMDRVGELLPPEEEAREAEEGGIRVAVIGRPNIGKSTLVNRLVGEERQLVHDAPGTTRDPVDVAVEVGGRRFVFVDTAGVRRRTRIQDRVEGLAAARAIRSIERCHVSLLVLDGELGPTDQDARLAHLVEDRGRALVIVVNRWDRVRAHPERNVRVVADELDRQLPHVRWAPRLYVSALTGKGCDRILPMVERVYERFDRRIPTAGLNRFLERAVSAFSPPQRHHRPVRLNYLTQVRVRPPTFALFCNTPEGVTEPYRRYLANRLREAWDLEGTPIRLHVRRKRRPGE